MSGTAQRTAGEIPVAHTPPGGYGDTFPDPILGGLQRPDRRRGPGPARHVGGDRVVADGKTVAGHPALGSVQRIEQCGDRMVVTGGGIIHDMRCDGTEEHGVHDVAEFDMRTPITVVASYEDGVHVLRPVGLPIEVTRRRDGEQMVWDYLGFTARLRARPRGRRLIVPLRAGSPPPAPALPHWSDRPGGMIGRHVTE